MKVLVASDKWRGSFGSAQAGLAIAAGVHAAFPRADVQVMPLADGGEGTLDVLVGAGGGGRLQAEAAGPLGAARTATWARLADGRAVIESAQAAGLALVPEAARDPLRATSRGVGDLLRAALDAGCTAIVLALGGTATVDGGAGLARALGFRLLDAKGDPLPEGGGALVDLASIDASAADPRLQKAEIEAWCDVTNPLLGPRGAARTYAPQKGADPDAVERLERGLARLAQVAGRDLGAEVADLPGAGAAGGLGAGAAAFLGARLVSGAGRVLEAVGFDRHLVGADLVITGEGRYDPDAMPGKLPDVVLARAAARGVRAAILCGDLAAEAGSAPVPTYSRRDLIDNRGWDLGPRDLAELAEVLARRELGA